LEITTMAVPKSTKGPYNTLTAAGTTQADAALINADTVMVDSAANLSGVILGDQDQNGVVMIVNGVSNVEIKVYPKIGGKINNMTANLPVILSPNRAASFRAINNLDVICFV
jgi:hypothetical protein